MLKKEFLQGTALLAMTGVLVVGGTGGLGLAMAKVQQASVATESAVTTTGSAVATDSAKSAKVKKADKTEEKSGQKDSSQYEKIKEKLDLPKNAVITQEKVMKPEGEPEYLQYTIEWDGFTITYEDGVGGVSKKDADMNMEQAITKAKEKVKELSKVDISGGEISYMRLGIEKADVKVDNDKNYGTRYYEIGFDTKKQSFSVRINSITGEVYSYVECLENANTEEELKKNKVLIDGCTEKEYGYELSYDMEIKEAEKVYNPIAVDFVENTLKKSKVTKCYNLKVGTTGAYRDKEMLEEIKLEDGTSALYLKGPVNRGTMVLNCLTEDGDIVEITIDQVNKTVQSYDINPLFILD